MDRKNCGNEIFFSEIHPFEFSIKYSESKDISPSPHHTHDECEIYICCGGDISFMVEKHMYPVNPGNVIITRPREYHHCISGSNKTHKHFCILFSSNGNEKFLNSFFQRQSGVNNLIELSPEKSSELINICFEMIEKDTSVTEKYILFFRMISLLGNGRISNESAQLPEDITSAIEYIDRYINKPITVKDVANHVHTSVNTLERHFGKSLQISPAKYIKRKKLALASVLLKRQMSLQDVCEQCGFTDYNGFIASFKSEFGITPGRYRKNLI